MNNMQDQDLLVSVLSSDQITALESHQLSLPFGSMDSGIDTLTVSSPYMLTDDNSVSIDWSQLNTTVTPLTMNDLTSPWDNNNVQVESGGTSGKIKLTGDDADIEINGESVVGVLKEIRDRLGIIQVSEAMEAEWDELKQLREQYEAKLAECREKSQAWNALKQMPPPQMP